VPARAHVPGHQRTRKPGNQCKGDRKIHGQSAPRTQGTKPAGGNKVSSRARPLAQACQGSLCKTEATKPCGRPSASIRFPIRTTSSRARSGLFFWVQPFTLHGRDGARPSMGWPQNRRDGARPSMENRWRATVPRGRGQWRAMLCHGRKSEAAAKPTRPSASLHGKPVEGHGPSRPRLWKSCRRPDKMSAPEGDEGRDPRL